MEEEKEGTGAAVPATEQEPARALYTEEELQEFGLARYREGLNANISGRIAEEMAPGAAGTPDGLLLPRRSVWDD